MAKILGIVGALVVLRFVIQAIGRGVGAEEELENCCQSLRVIGETKMPLARVGFAGDTLLSFEFSLPSGKRNITSPIGR